MSGKERVSAPEALKAIERLRTTVDGLPEVTEEVDGFGHVSFRVRDKPFVMFGNGSDGEGSLSIKSDPHTQAFLVQHRPFVKTPYIGQHGWVSVEALPPEDWAEVETLVVEGYRLAAPKALARRVPREDPA